MRIGVGTRVMYDGAVHEVTEWIPTVCGTDVVLRGPNSVCRMSVVELVSGTRVRLLIDSSGPESTDQMVPAAVVLSSLPKRRLEEVRERAAHVREVLTGYRSGSSDIAEAGEPRAEFDHSRPLCDRYAAKAAELGVDERTDSPVGQGIRGERRSRFGPRTIRPTEQDRPTVERSSAGHHA